MSWTNADRIKNGSMPDKTFVQCTESIRHAAVYMFVLHSPDQGNSVFAEKRGGYKKSGYAALVQIKVFLETVKKSL